MKTSIVIVIFCDLLFYTKIIYPANPTSVPVSHPIYNYLERMETLGYVQNLLDGIRPYSRINAAWVMISINYLKIV